MKNENIEVGSKVKEKVTGLVGKVTAKCFYLYGPVRCGIELVDQSGTHIERWFEIDRLELISE
jgi:hypothetical protein